MRWTWTRSRLTSPAPSSRPWNRPTYRYGRAHAPEAPPGREDLRTSAPAVAGFGLPEVHDADDQGDDGPPDSGQPELAAGDRGVAEGLQGGGLLRGEQGALGVVVGLRARRVVALGGHDRVPGQGDVHRRGIERQHVLGPFRQRGGKRGDAVHDPAEVAPDPGQERDQLAEVLRARAQPG